MTWTVDDWLENWRSWARPWDLCGPKISQSCGSIERLHVLYRNPVLTAEEEERFLTLGDLRGPPKIVRGIVDGRRGEFIEKTVVAMREPIRSFMVAHYMKRIGMEKMPYVAIRHNREGRFQIAKAVSAWK